MRVLLVLAMIPLLAACSVFSSSEPSATVADTPAGTETAAAPETSGDPTTATDTNVTLAPVADQAPEADAPVAAKEAEPVAAKAPEPIAAAAPEPIAAKAPAPEPAPEAPVTSPGTNIAGKWTGMWVGVGLFNAPRQENLSLEIAQRGDAGYGRLVLDGATAAESVPWEVRQQGLGGIRVFATVNGSKVRLTHELDDRLFTADLTVVGDQMVGEVKGRRVRLLLARQSGGSNAPARDVPPQAAQLAPPIIPSQPYAPQPVAMAPQPQPQAQEPEQPKAAEAVQRPLNEEYVAAPELKPLYFDFDKSVLRPDAVDALSNNVTWLKENADTFVLIEGNADERGTAEYNLALGDRRAKSAMDYLEANGIAKDRLSTVSYGKERPICTDATEECRALNRRADFRIKSR
jgi:peptidoglycan-associated lipoprotein